MSRRSRTDSTEGLEGSLDGELPGLPGAIVDEFQPGEAIVPAEASANTPARVSTHEQPAAAPEPQADPPKRYVVAPGRGITVRRGTLGEGDAVRETDLSAEQVRELVTSGHLVAK